MKLKKPISFLIFLFLLFYGFSQNSGSCQSQIISGTERSKNYRLEVDGKDIFVEKFKDISYAYVILTGKSKFVIKTLEKFKDCTISPLNSAIKFIKSSNNVEFEVNRPQKLVARFDSLAEKLFIFIEAPEHKNIIKNRKNIVSIRNYGVNGKGDKEETKAIQKALDDISGRGKVLYFPAGLYLTGTLNVKSNSVVYLAEGATIKGSDNRDDFPVDPGYRESDAVNDKAHYTDNGEHMTFSRLLLIDHAENVILEGKGTIDGSGSILRSKGKPANLIRIRQSKNVVIDGLTLRDPAAWNIHILYSEQVTIRNVKILNDRSVPNTDGIDPDASHNVLIDNCFAYCSDDNIAIKSSNNGNLLRDADGITIKNCVFLTKKSSLKVGTETQADTMKNILFENNDVIESDRGMALYCPDGAIFKNIKFLNNRFESFYPDSKQCGMHFVINKRNADSNPGKMTQILVKDCKFFKPFPKKSEILGFDPDHGIEITIENLTIAAAKCKNLGDANIKTNDFADVIFK